MMSKLANVTRDTFEQQVLRVDRPVLVDFHAEWCGPCRAQAPALESVAESFDGGVDVVKVDVDQNPELAQRYGVRSIPTLILFNSGEPVETRIGLNSEAALRELFRSVA
jgi:thioredoxin 1